MHKLIKKFFIGSSILLLVFLVAQNLEVDDLSSPFKKAIGFELYKEGENQAYPINHKDSLSVLRHSAGFQSSFQVANNTNKIQEANILTMQEVNRSDLEREYREVQYELINLRIKALLEQLGVRPK
jgi:hypothetical protein